MVVKVYISGISGNKEVKKRQQRVLMILDSKNIKYDIIDIAEPGREDDKDFMQSSSKSNGGTVSDPNPRSPLPPQLFNDDEYCGDYDQFDLANEIDTLEQFLKVEAPPEEPPQAENGPVNGDAAAQKQEGATQSKENSQERDLADGDKPSKEASPGKEGTPAKESKEGTPAKEDTPSKEGTPVRESTPAKEGTPARETSIEKESTPDRQKSKSPEKDATLSKEGTPDIAESVNENGAVSSREQSVEKAGSEIAKKDSPSETLIESEQAAAAE